MIGAAFSAPAKRTQSRGLLGENVDAKARTYFFILIYLCLIVGAAILCFNTAPERMIALALYAPFALLTLYHNRQHNRTAGAWRWGRLFVVIEFGLALCVQYFDHTPFSGFGVVIVIAMASRAGNLRFGIAFAGVSLATSTAMQYLQFHHSMQSFWQSIGTIILPRVFMTVSFLIARYNSVISAENRQLTDLLQQKTNELEVSLSKLRAYADDLKETADLRARDRLMRDLHDTLGHMLATASINAQAVTVLIDKDASAAKARLATVIQQIQTAMQSLRDVLSGKTMDYSGDALTSAQFISLMRETEKRTEIPIHIGMFMAEDYDALPVACRSFLYNALMEGLTNGIRHGGVTRFDFSLSKSAKMLYFTLRDNGTGFQELKYGYGLSKIRRDAQRLGGQLKMAGQSGCEMQIALPILTGKESEVLLNG